MKKDLINTMHHSIDYGSYQEEQNDYEGLIQLSELFDKASAAAPRRSASGNAAHSSSLIPSALCSGPKA